MGQMKTVQTTRYSVSHSGIVPIGWASRSDWRTTRPGERFNAPKPPGGASEVKAAAPTNDSDSSEREVPPPSCRCICDDVFTGTDRAKEEAQEEEEGEENGQGGAR
jgi:hypothetical protein